MRRPARCNQRSPPIPTTLHISYSRIFVFEFLKFPSDSKDKERADDPATAAQREENVTTLAQTMMQVR